MPPGGLGIQLTGFVNVEKALALFVLVQKLRGVLDMFTFAVGVEEMWWQPNRPWQLSLACLGVFAQGHLHELSPLDPLVELFCRHRVCMT